MIKRLPIYIAIILICSVLNYIATNNILLTLIVAILGLISFILIIEKFITDYDFKLKRNKECIWFINNFLITLSINQSIRLTFITLKESFSKDLKRLSTLNEQVQVEDQIKSFKNYFNSDLYNVFLNLLDQYIFNGGEILKISQILIFDTRKRQEIIDSHVAIVSKKLLEYSSLWITTFIILVVIKISLNQFYTQISSGIGYQIGLLFFFLIFYLNSILFAYHSCNLKFIKEINEQDKIKKDNKQKFNFRFKRTEEKHAKIKRKHAKSQ